MTARKTSEKYSEAFLFFLFLFTLSQIIMSVHPVLGEERY
jgi:hypothetical protein